MNTAALVIAAGLPMYDSMPAAMFNVGSVSTAQHMISAFEKAGGAEIFLVTDDATKKLEKQLSEVNKYEEIVHHFADMRVEIDLDDGVKVNYAKFAELLTKIK